MKKQFTAITETRVLRVAAKSELAVRTACHEVGIAVLAIEVDA